jgi:DNA mismatch repair protein MutS
VALHYLNETEHRNLQHISAIGRIEEDRYLWLDRFSIRNLELVGSANENALTLVDVLDHTCSPMGARMLRRWIVMPLKEIKPINDRLGVVEYLIAQEELREDLQQYIRQIGDLERLISKIGLQKANPREVCQLKKALMAIETIKKLTSRNGRQRPVKSHWRTVNPCVTICEKIARELHPEPPVMIVKGSVMNEGINEELDSCAK